MTQETPVQSRPWVSYVKTLLPAAVLVALMLVLYWPTLDDPFHGDDYVAFSEFKTKSFIEYTEDVFLFRDSNFYWRPLGKVLHRGLYEAFGLDPTAFRAAGLAFFTGTLLALYVFCLRERLGHGVAAVAAALFLLVPSQVVSVAWVTNTSRHMAVLGLVLCLLALQASGRRRPIWEVAAWLAFLLAVLSDETALGLAPVPVLYAAFVRNRRLAWKSAAVRAFAYGALVVALVPLQFANTLDDEPRLGYYGPGEHMLTQGWALVSQLVLPITRPNPWEIMLADISSLQWAAGLVAIFLAAVVLLFGTMRLRLLVVWAGLALAPFTLWDVTYTSPRYVNFAVVPYSILLSWAVTRAFTALTARAPDAGGLRLARAAVLAPMMAALVAAALAGAAAIQARNDDWSHETAKYGFLTRELPREVPSVPSGSRIVVIFGQWPEPWATAAIRTVYGDRSVSVVSVRPFQVYIPAAKGDIVVYALGDRFLRAPLGAATR